MKNEDPLRGALIGGVLGGATAGIGSAFGGAAAGEAATLGATEVANVGGQQAVQNVLGEGAKNVLTEIPTETGGLFQNAGGQLVDQSGQLIDQGAQAGINQLAQNAAPGSFLPYDPMQAGQEGFKYVGPQGIQTAPNVTQFNPAEKGFFDQSSKTWLGDKPLSPFLKMAAPAVATAFTPMFDKTSANKYGVPPPETYTGPLSKFKYDPSTYSPDVVVPPNPHYQANYSGYAFAEGGITQLATGGSAPLIGTPAQNTTMESTMGNNAMFPMSEMARSYYATPTQLPAGINAQNNPNPATSGYESKVDTNTGQMLNNFAGGGIAGLLKGQGDGMSDNIHATIGGNQPARLADGEFVIPADVVSHLGNGSTDAGAKHLYSMMDKVRKARTGRKSQGKQISAGGYLPV